jgi:hypothetical protein
MKRKKLTKLSFEALEREMPVLTEQERRDTIGGYHVIITMNRYGYGTNATASTFTATAYDNCGNVVGTSISGYMLEPATNYDLSTTSGSDTAIASGSYSIIKRNDGKYEITGVPGRSGILIHTGTTGGNTTGCLMPGTTMSYSNSSNSDNSSSNYNGSNSDYGDSDSTSSDYGNSGLSSDSISSNSDYGSSSSDPYNPSGDYYIPGGQGYSTNMFDALVDFMEQYGQDGVTINITG